MKIYTRVPHHYHCHGNSTRGVASIMRRAVRIIINQGCAIYFFLMRMYGATDDVRYKLATLSRRRRISDITRTETRTRKDVSGLRDSGWYIRAVQAELSFSLVLVKSFIDLAWHLAWQGVCTHRSRHCPL